MRLLTPLLLIFTSLFCIQEKSYAQPIQRQSKDYALLFAVNDYANMPDLQKPIRDAQDIAEELKTNYGFTVEVIENPTLDQIDAKLIEYERKFTNGTFDQKGQLFVFFSGHGLSKRGNGYFMTHNASPDAPHRTAMEYDYYRGLIDEIPCQHIMVAIDACHSAAFDPNFGMRNDRRFKRPGEAGFDRILANHEAYRTRFFLTSDAVDKQTPDASEFTYRLLEGLRSPPVNGKYWRSSELYTLHLEQAVPRPGGGVFGSDEPGSCFLFFPTQDTSTQVNTNQVEPPPQPNIPDNFIYVPGGTFPMGDQPEISGSDKAVHRVELSAFYISPYEVTFAEYDAFCAATVQKTPKDRGWGRGQHPAINVSWCDAVAYANWLSIKNNLDRVYSGPCDNIRVDWTANGYRLPTEAEWEFAARQGGQAVRFGHGKNIADPVEINYRGEGMAREQTTTVGKLNNANALGLYDMSGNVWEWCWDWYANDYYGNAMNKDPRGPHTGSSRVFRGGGWRSSAQECEATQRNYLKPTQRANDLGFRLARSATY